MRLAFFSPLPPSKSGIADYSAALLTELKRLAEVDVFTATPDRFDPTRYNGILYQLGNNPFHTFVYEAAMAHPGVVVMHESNLHHLLADLTIRRGDWDAYLREVEKTGTPSDVLFSQRVRALEVGPDYEGLPMIRSVLQRSKGAIAHSQAVCSDLRSAGYAGPAAVIPHGAWLVNPDGLAYRRRLGLSESTPLAGIFGFLKPYKRIAESLRAFKRVLRELPEAKLILVGEPHPEFRLADLIDSLKLGESVRMLGFAEMDDFNGYIAACDVVLNLRYPTVGESSGTLLRSFGMGRAVIVSSVGSFAEYPDEICLKAPVNATEEDYLFEYLMMLLSRPDLARALGERARAWVTENCSWRHVAGQYVEFLQAVSEGSPWPPTEPERALAAVAAVAPVTPETAEETVMHWAPPEAEPRKYLRTHITRLGKTLSITPPGSDEDHILEMGAYLQITPALHTQLGYGHVRGCYYGPAGIVDHRSVRAESGEEFECDIDLFDAERDRFPYCDQQFRTVLCCELLEHLPGDPMHMMSEINRILKPGGHLVLTTPNIASLRAVAAILHGYHPGFFPAYIRPSGDEEPEARHNREYAPREIGNLLQDGGFEVTLLETGPFLEEPQPELAWVSSMLERYRLPVDLRGDGIYAVGRKTGPIRVRYPAWLYSGGD